MDEELLRQARAALADTQADDFSWQGRQPRLVRADGTISVRERTFGPLDSDLVGMSVDVDLRGPALEVFYNRDLRHRFDFESGETLPLDDEPVAVAAAQAREA
jgi:N utilization substance protein A